MAKERSDMELNIPEELKQSLKFGDQKQIIALRQLQDKAEYESLPDCKECGGDGRIEKECPTCEHYGYVECEECEGEGKDAKAMEEYWSKH